MAKLVQTFRADKEFAGIIDKFVVDNPGMTKQEFFIAATKNFLSATKGYKYQNGDKVCLKCAREIDKKNQYLPWFSEQLRAKDKWIENLLGACEYLAKEYNQIHGEGSLPGFVDAALEKEK